MRAKTVNFERGQDPKDALGIGKEEAREFRKALKSDDTFRIPVISNIINGLTDGFISIAEAERFIRKSIGEYDKYRKLIWYDWMYDDGEIFWDKHSESLVIKFPMPNNEKSDIIQEREIRTTIAKSMSKVNGEMIKTRILAKVEDPATGYTEEHFDKDNWFMPTDQTLKMAFIINTINSVVTETIHNLG